MGAFVKAFLADTRCQDLPIWGGRSQPTVTVGSAVVMAHRTQTDIDSLLTDSVCGFTLPQVPVAIDQPFFPFDCFGGSVILGVTVAIESTVRRNARAISVIRV